MISTHCNNKNFLLVALALASTTSSSHAEYQLRWGDADTATTTTEENASASSIEDPYPLVATLPLRRSTITKRTVRRGLRSRRNLKKEKDEGSFCPTSFPGSGTNCNLSGRDVGTCYWGATALERACSCNEDGQSTFRCWELDTWNPNPNHPDRPPSDSNMEYEPQAVYKDPFSDSNMEMEPQAVYKDVFSDNNMEYTNTNTETGSYDNMEYTISITKPTITNASIEPQEIECPQFVPADGSACNLTGMWVGTCYWSSTHQAGEMPNDTAVSCVCNHDGTSKFSCQ